jgi:hypothetical protein
MANYTIDDIQNALQQNLISEEDAQYLAQELEGSVPATAAGAGLGAAALGAAGLFAGGAAGKRLAQSGAKALADGAEPGMMRKAGNWLGKPTTSEPTINQGDVVGALSGAGLGAVGGGMAANAMTGGGVDGEMTPSGPDRDAMLQMLMDPNTDPRQKKQIMQMLQEMDAQMPPGEAGVGADSGIDGAMLGAGLGGAALGAAGAKLGGKLGQKMGHFMDAPMPMPTPGMAAKAPKVGTVAGGGAGALMGGGAGMLADQDMSPYAEPF